MGSQTAEAASKAGEGSQAMSLYGQMADVGGKGSAAGGAGVQPVEPASGFSMQTEGANTGQGPTVTNDAALTRGAPNDYNTGAAQGIKDMREYGTANPTFVDKVVNTLERFQKGNDQGLFKTKLGNNPETYGAAYGLATKMAGSGKPQSGAPITTNISYQQPENPYLRKRGRY